MCDNKIHEQTEAVKCCKDCQVVKPWSEFYIYNATGKPYARCKECHNELNRKNEIERKLGLRPSKKRRVLDPNAKEKACSKCGAVKPMREYHKGSQIDGKASQCKECVADTVMRRAYIHASEEDFAEHESKSACDCCGVEVGGANKCFDHCHETGAYRGTLCRRCNTVEGFLVDSATAKSMHEYMLRNERLRG